MTVNLAITAVLSVKVRRIINAYLVVNKIIENLSLATEDFIVPARMNYCFMMILKMNFAAKFTIRA